MCDLETSRMGAPYIYDISSLRVKKLKNEKLTVYSKMITVNVVSCQERAVLFSGKIQDFTTDLKHTQSSEIK